MENNTKEVNKMNLLIETNILLKDLLKEVLLKLFNGEGIRNPDDLRWVNERDIGPCLVHYVGVKELQTVKIEFDRAPGKSFKQIVEVVKELIGGQVIDLAVKILSDPSDGPRVGLGQHAGDFRH